MVKRVDKPNFMYRKTLVVGPRGYTRPIEDIRPGEEVIGIVGGNIFNVKPTRVKAVHDFGMQPCFRTCFQGLRVFKPGKNGTAGDHGYKPDKKEDIIAEDGQWAKVLDWHIVIDHGRDLEILCHPDWSGKNLFQVRRMQDYFRAAWTIFNVYDSQDLIPASANKMMPLTGLRHMYGLELEDRNAFFLLQNGLIIGSV